MNFKLLSVTRFLTTFSIILILALPVLSTHPVFANGEPQPNPEYTLSLYIDGNGSVTLNNTGPYHYGDVVQLTAVPGVNCTFESWTGDLYGSDNPTIIFMNDNKAVNVWFESIYHLTLRFNPNEGHVYTNISGSTPLHYGVVVEFTAVPSIGYRFDHWGSDLSGSVNPTTLLYDGNKTVDAFFTQTSEGSVGGYSVHVSTSMVQPFTVYAMLVCLFGAVLTALRRKGK